MQKDPAPTSSFPRTHPGKVDKRFSVGYAEWVAGIFDTCPVSQTALYLQPGGPRSPKLPSD